MIEEAHSLTGELLRALLILILLVPLAWLATRLYAQRVQRRSTLKMLDVVAVTTLAPARMLYVVKAGERLLLLGVTPQTISLITEISDPDEVETWLNCTEEPPGSLFQSALRKAMGSEKAGREADE